MKKKTNATPKHYKLQRKICPDCFTVLSATAKVCPNCGFKFKGYTWEYQIKEVEDRNRLTEKVGNEYLTVEDESEVNWFDFVEKLGKLEDIMEKYHINSPEELEQRLIEFGAVE